MSKKVDAYIEEEYVNGEVNYNMWLHYNDVEFCFLYANPEAAAFASYFKNKLYSNDDGFTFTDSHGSTTSRSDYDSVLASVKGLDNIDRALMPIIGASTNLDIESDLIVHLNGEEFKLVGDADDKEYRPDSSFSKKGLSFEVLGELDKRLKTLKTGSIGQHSK